MSGETMQGNARSVEYHYNRLYSTNYNQSIEYTSSAGNWSRAEINVVTEEVSEPRVARKVRSTQWISAGNIERRKVQGPDAGFLMVG